MKTIIFLKKIAIWIIVLSSLSLAYTTHLVILNIRSYTTLGIEATGEPNYIPVIISLITLIMGFKLFGRCQLCNEKTNDLFKKLIG